MRKSEYNLTYNKSIYIQNLPIYTSGQYVEHQRIRSNLHILESVIFSFLVQAHLTASRLTKLMIKWKHIQVQMDIWSRKLNNNKSTMMIEEQFNKP